MTLNVLGIATTGGDAPRMNAAVRAAVRTVVANGLRVIGFDKRARRLLEMLETKFDLLEKKAFLAGDILVLFLRSRSS